MVVDTEVFSKTGIYPNSQKSYQITTSDLPLSCPMPGMMLWCSHPKVYLSIEYTNFVKCPYCGSEYKLVTANSKF
jgi:uncharacterized Zn-finger protein